MLERVAAIRRAIPLGRASRRGAPSTGERLDALEERLAHLERMIEGLQDATHREIVRMNGQIQRLLKRTEPEEMTRSLSRSARRRGL